MYEGKHIHFSEIDNKPLCSYSPKLCKQRRLNGYAFCIRHVLEDKTAPFKQCQYVAKYNNQRCTNPIPKAEDRVYCNSHLQVLGLVPKKERKKKSEQLDEPRERQRERVVQHIAELEAPPVLTRVPNGLHALTPAWQTLSQSPHHHPHMAPATAGAPTDDPFAFPEDDEHGLRKVAVKRKLQGRPPIGTSGGGSRSRLVAEKNGEVKDICGSGAIINTSASSPGHLKPHKGTPPPTKAEAHGAAASLRSAQPPPMVHRHGERCLSRTPVGTTTAVQRGLVPPTPPESRVAGGKALGGATTGAAASASSSSSSSSSSSHTSARAAQRHTQPDCERSRALRRLLYRSRQRKLLDQDLFTHLGCDWSEDESSEDEDKVLPCQSTWLSHQDRLGEHGVLYRSECTGSDRETRIAALYSSLRHRYLQLSRVERAAARRQRHLRAHSRALLRGAALCPDGVAVLLRRDKQPAATHQPGTLHPQPATSHQQPATSHQQPATHPVASKEAPAASAETVRAGQCCVQVKGQLCRSPTLPYSLHCFQHILCSSSQRLFSSCTARFADGQQCSVPVFDIVHQTPLCEEHAKKMDNFLRGDWSRKAQQQQQQQRKPRKKSKPPALSKKHKKKRRRPTMRPQKPIPPAEPQGNLCIPAATPPPSTPIVTEPSCVARLSPVSGDVEEDDIAPELSDELELNQEDLDEVLPKLHVDLHDFDLFEGKNGELLPTKEEAEALERALVAASHAVTSLEHLGSMDDDEELVASDDLGSFNPDLHELLGGTIAADSFSALDLEQHFGSAGAVVAAAAAAATQLSLGLEHHHHQHHPHQQLHHQHQQDCGGVSVITHFSPQMPSFQTLPLLPARPLLVKPDGQASSSTPPPLIPAGFVGDGGSGERSVQSPLQDSSLFGSERVPSPFIGIDSGEEPASVSGVTVAVTTQFTGSEESQAMLGHSLPPSMSLSVPPGTVTTTTAGLVMQRSPSWGSLVLTDASAFAAGAAQDGAVPCTASTMLTYSPDGIPAPIGTSLVQTLASTGAHCLPQALDVTTHSPFSASGTTGAAAQSPALLTAELAASPLGPLAQAHATGQVLSSPGTSAGQDLATAAAVASMGTAPLSNSAQSAQLQTQAQLLQQQQQQTGSWNSSLAQQQHKLPQFSAAFGSQLSSGRGGIPKDVQPLCSVVPPLAHSTTASTLSNSGGSGDGGVGSTINAMPPTVPPRPPSSTSPPPPTSPSQGKS
uniref:INO80 complex subunit D isoform X2 n=1 Tax=Petromyzon marinus TaxID=7757 RepID=A0AAJ7X659_PETMA|nr:INO80 complex subunit D isoform X2 [Petromyzon marinus]